MVAGGIATVAATALADGAAGLSRYAIALFQPLAPMLAQPADDIEDAMARIPMAALEWKLDGARVQVHKDGDEVRIYSRTGNDVTRRRARDRVGGPGAAARDADPRRRSHRAQAERSAAIRFRTRCAGSAACSTSRPCARRCRCRYSSSTACAATSEDLVPLPAAAALRGPDRGAALRAADSPPGHRATSPPRRPSTTTRSSAGTKA